MSLSDFTISSPRKGQGGGGKNGGLSYDDDFKRFLNDTSESDVSNSKKLSTKKPWWMKEDDEDEDESALKGFKKKTNNATSKSFIKEKKLNATLESDEFVYEEKKAVEKLPVLSMDNNSTLSSSQMNESRQKKSGEFVIDEEDEIELEEEEEEEEEKDLNLSEKLTRQDGNSEISNENKVNKELKETRSTNGFSKSLNSANTENKNNDGLSNETKPALNKIEPAGNLLSKVMFMETMTSVEGGTLDRPLFQTLDKNNKQIGNQRQHTTQNAHRAEMNSKLNTQTRRDLEELEKVYRDLAESAVLVKTNALNESLFLSARQKSDEANEEIIHTNDLFKRVMSSSELEYNASKAIIAELEERALKEILKELDQKPVKESQKKSSLNEARFYQTRKEAKKEEEEDNTRQVDVAWPPKKYRNVKGTGYGTTWRPSKKNLDESLNIIKSLSNLNRSLSNLQQQQKSQNRVNQQTWTKSKQKSKPEDSFASSDEEEEEDEHKQLILELKNELIKRQSEHELDIKEMRLELNKQLSDQRLKFEILTSQLNDKRKELNDGSFKIEDELKDESVGSELASLRDKCKVLEKNRSEQDELIRGYQVENERLYAELKSVKEQNRKEKVRLNDEVNELKFALIQEKMSFEKQLKQQQETTTKCKETSLKKIMPSIEPSRSSIDLNELQQLRDLLKETQIENSHLNQKLKLYENAQSKQRDSDLKVIQMKNSEIKQLNERLKCLESGRNAPQCLREIKQLKKQLREMEILVRELRNGVSTEGSIDYYEQRIKLLEFDLREKSDELSRLGRIWKEKNKFHLNPQTEFDIDAVDKKLNQFIFEYLEKIKKLETINGNLNSALNASEEKVKDLAAKLTDSEDLIKKLNTKINELNEKSKIVKKIYEPNEFKNKLEESEDFLNLTSQKYKLVLNELDAVKTKLKTAEGKLLERDKETEVRIEQVRKKYDEKMGDLLKRHKYEVDKLLRVFTGGFIEAKFDNELNFNSVFDDQIQIRLLMNARDKFNESKFKMEKQSEVIARLNEECSELMAFRQKCEYLEEANEKLNKELNEAKNELAVLKKVKNSTGMNSFDYLKEKILRMEQSFLKREEEMKNFKSPSKVNLNTIDENEQLAQLKIFYEKQLELKNKELAKFKTEFENMLQILYAL